MTETFSELAQFLSQEHTIAEVTGRVGKTVKDPGPPLPVVIEPHLAGVKSATLSRYPKDGKPYLLTLGLHTGPTVAAMREKFGAFERLDSDLGRPPQLLFKVPAGAAWRIVLIAELEPAANAIDSDHVVSLAFRRDPITH